MKLNDYHKKRAEIFGRKSPTFIDSCLTSHGYISFDVVQFDEWLQKTHGVPPDGVSCKQQVFEVYGKKAVQFIESALERIEI